MPLQCLVAGGCLLRRNPKGRRRAQLLVLSSFWPATLLRLNGKKFSTLTAQRNVLIRESHRKAGYCGELSEKAMAPHSSTLAWKIPWTEEPGGLQSMGSRRVGHDWATLLLLFTVMHWRRKWQPTPVFLPGEFQGRGAWWAAISGVAQSRTRLKRLSSMRAEIPTLKWIKLGRRPEVLKLCTICLVSGIAKHWS